jgi:DNA-binding CsgD family transcriptional regulator
LCQLAQILLVSQTEQAREPMLLEERLALSKQLGFKEGKAASLCLSAQLALIKGDLKNDEGQAQHSLRLYRRLEQRHGTTEALLVVGRVLAAQGEYASARTRYEEGLAVARQVGDKLYIASCLEGLAGVAAGQGDFVRAVRLWGAAASLREMIGAPIPPVERDSYERSVASARSRLKESIFSAVWAEGRALTLEQVTDESGLMPLPVTLPMSSPVSSKPWAAKLPVTYPDGLTAREVEVLRLVARGFTDAQVAEQLVISPRTVNGHLSSIYGKIGATSRTGATRYAIEHKLA